MIRRIRALSSALQEPPTGAASCEEEVEVVEDPGLELLVRNAIRHEVAAHDGGHVWQRLSKRVRGPFGCIAIEEPAMRGFAMPLIGETAEPAEPRPESMRHSLFRTAEATFSLR